MPILAHIAAQTKTIRLGAGVSVLPFHHPIRLAEEAAMVDVLSDGRLNFGVGRGSANYEYGNFKIDFDSRDTRFQEALDIILGLWTTEDFTYHGQYYQVDGLTIAPRPLQKPHPPVHLAVSRTAASVDVAVGRDLPLLPLRIPVAGREGSGGISTGGHHLGAGFEHLPAHHHPG